jgi:oligoendopeptidase F
VTITEPADSLPRWSVADVHESFDSRSFSDAKERSTADVERLIVLFDELNIRATDQRALTDADGTAADRVIIEFNRVSDDLDLLDAYVYATVSTDSRNAQAQSLLARLAEWVKSLGADRLAAVSTEARDHIGPLSRFAERATHQMSESEEHLYAELSTTGSGAWGRLQSDVTSQLTTEVDLPNGHATLPMPAVRGLATHADPAVRRAAYNAELAAWPTVEVPVAAAMNAIKGEANVINRRRKWTSPLDASLFGNSVSTATFEAMQSAVTTSLPDFRRWMQVKAQLHGHAPERGLPWWDLVAPLPIKASPSFATPSANSAPASVVLSTGPSTSNGSTRSHATANGAARSVCHSEATAHS